MADRVGVIKWESPAGGGTETDLVPTELDPNEDHPTVRGLFIQNDTSSDEAVHVSRDSSDRMTFMDDENPTPVTLSDLVAGAGGLTEASHELLDTLKHNFAEDGHQQVTRTSGKVSNITIWTDSGETQKIRELDITRSAGLVSQIDLIQYDGTGTEKMRITGAVTRSGGRVDHIDWTETVA